MNNTNKVLAFIEAPNTTKAFIEFLNILKSDAQKSSLTLTHVLKESTGEKSLMDELMGDTTAEKTPDDVRKLLNGAKEELLKHGFTEGLIDIDILRSEGNSTVTDRLVEKIEKGNYSTVVLSRKRNMSKAEEFALGDVSSRLVRAPIKTTVVVLKTD